MCAMPIAMSVDRTGWRVPKFLDLFEYVGGNATADPQYYKYMHADGYFVISRLSGVGTVNEKMMYSLNTGGSEALNILWGDGSDMAAIAALTYVEYDLVY